MIALVKGGMSEALVIRTLKAEGKAYKLSTADLLKLTNAGVSEAIINAMTEGGGAAAGARRAPLRSRARRLRRAGGATPFPPDLPDAPASARKRRMAVSPFDYSTVITWVNYWFNSPYNIGEGIRAMLTVRMAQSNTITLLERDEDPGGDEGAGLRRLQPRAEGHGREDRPAHRAPTSCSMATS